MLLLGATLAWADHQPLWELRLGAGAAQIPYYRGSSQVHQYVLPVPAFTYRGERLRMGDGGIEGILFRSDRAKLDVSLAAGLPARSDDESPRAGMPRLNTTFELGPSLEFNAWRHSQDGSALWVILPLRAALSFDDFDVTGIGAVFTPYLEWVHLFGSWRATISLGPLFGSQAYHSYFYDVEAQYATAIRPEYHAAGGYSGSRIGIGLRRRTDKSWFRFYLRYDSLAGAQFEESPLLQQESYLAAGIAMTWRVWKSSQPAKHTDSPLDPRSR